MTPRAPAPLGPVLAKGKHMTRLPDCRRVAPLLLAAAMLMAGLPSAVTAQTLQRIGAAGKMVFGYEAEARPFSSVDEAGQPTGFAIALCGKIAEEVRTRTGRTDLALEWQAVDPATRLDAVREGRIDLLCGADGITLARREEVSFSLPVFPSGTGAVLRADAPVGLAQVLLQEKLPVRAIWRGAPARTFLDQKTFSALSGSIAEAFVTERMTTLQLSSRLQPVTSMAEGLQGVIDGKSSVFFAPLPVLLDAAARSPDPGQLIVLPRHFTDEPVGFALARGDEEFRLLVDRALSHAYRDPAFRDLFLEWFGTAGDEFTSFYRQTALPD
jgi:polar amino acid transport system substrate-binding protein